MKRLLAAVMAMMLLALPAIGEGLDLSGMSLDELNALQKATVQEILSRVGLVFDDAILSSGRYIAGVDIKPGKYELICTMIATEQTNYSLKVYGDIEDNKSILYQTFEMQVGQHTFITLEDGNALVIDKLNFLIQPFDHSWAP